MPTSLLTPFQIVGGRVGSTTDTVVQVEQKILTTLLTNRLERIGIPDFGASISQLVFEDMDELVSADFKIDATREVSDRISGVTVQDIRVLSTEETTATVTVLYNLPLSVIREVTFKVVLPTSLTEESGY